MSLEDINIPLLANINILSFGLCRTATSFQIDATGLHVYSDQHESLIYALKGL